MFESSRRAVPTTDKDGKCDVRKWLVDGCEHFAPKSLMSDTEAGGELGGGVGEGGGLGSHPRRVLHNADPKRLIVFM